MELLDDHDPEEARAILDSILERMIAAVELLRGSHQPGDGRWHHDVVWRAGCTRASCAAGRLCGLVVGEPQLIFQRARRC